MCSFAQSLFSSTRQKKNSSATLYSFIMLHHHVQLKADEIFGESCNQNDCSLISLNFQNLQKKVSIRPSFFYLFPHYLVSQLGICLPVTFFSGGKRLISQLSRNLAQLIAPFLPSLLSLLLSIKFLLSLIFVFCQNILKIEKKWIKLDSLDLYLIRKFLREICLIYRFWSLFCRTLSLSQTVIWFHSWLFCS